MGRKKGVVVEAITGPIRQTKVEKAAPMGSAVVPVAGAMAIEKQDSRRGKGCQRSDWLIQGRFVASRLGRDSLP